MKNQTSKGSCTGCDICAGEKNPLCSKLRNHKDNEHIMKNNEINSSKELKSIKSDISVKIFTYSNEHEACLEKHHQPVWPKSVSPIVMRNILIFAN